MSNESVDFYLSFELFEKQDEIKQDGGKKKLNKKVNKKIKKEAIKEIELSDSITSIEYLSATSESEDSKYMINTIKDQLQSNLKEISD